MVKTKSENVLGKMILSRIDKIKALTKEAGSLNQSNKRYRSTTSRIIEDIDELVKDLEELEMEYDEATNDVYKDTLSNYLSEEIVESGYDLSDDEFLNVIKNAHFKAYTNFIRKRLRISKKYKLK